MPFDIGFIELCIIMVVALILLGPDKLPVAARGLTRVFRTVNRTMNSFKSEVSRELQMDELKRQMHEQQERLAKVVDVANNRDPLDFDRKQQDGTDNGSSAIPQTKHDS